MLEARKKERQTRKKNQRGKTGSSNLALVFDKKESEIQSSKGSGSRVTMLDGIEKKIKKNRSDLTSTKPRQQSDRCWIRSFIIFAAYVRRVLKGNNGDDDQRRGYGGAAYNSTRLYTVKSAGSVFSGFLPFSPAHSAGIGLRPGLCKIYV